jgi:hypothetical protein
LGEDASSEGGPAVGVEAHDVGRDSAAGGVVTRHGGQEWNITRKATWKEVRQGRTGDEAGLGSRAAWREGHTM